MSWTQVSEDCMLLSRLDKASQNEYAMLSDMCVHMNHNAILTGFISSH